MNQQKMEKPSYNNGMLNLHSIFHTIQGEGPFCGHPAIFVRLAGCNLQCPQCDTDYTSNRFDVSIGDIISSCQNIASNCLVVITGGEPFRQHIGGLVTMLVSYGYYVQIETNGTLPPSSEVIWSDRYWEKKGAYIVCSPKTGKMNPLLEHSACCFKYVVSADSVGNDGLPIHVLGLPSRVARPSLLCGRPLYIQPADSKNKAINDLNTLCAIESAQKFGYILQVQVHKLLNLE